MFRARFTAFRTLAAVLAALVAAALACTVVIGSGPAPRRALAAPPTTVPPAATSARSPEAAVPASPPPALIATVSADTPYSAVPGGPTVGTIPAKNPFGAADVVAVTDAEGVGHGRWLHVELPIRPNGSTGWIPGTSVTLTQTGYRVLVSLADRSLTVTDAGRTVLTTPVAVGKASTPTPPGRTYLWELIRPDDPRGPYGPYIFGLAEYSDAYAVFNGGDAQIGVHGQDEPWSIGYAVSNGCVRLPDDTIVKLAGMLPLGTPVTIS